MIATYGIRYFIFVEFIQPLPSLNIKNNYIGE